MLRFHSTTQVALVLAAFLAPPTGAFAQDTTTPAGQPAGSAGEATPGTGATGATGSQPGTGGDAEAVRTSQSRVIDTGREDLEREQGQTERERERARQQREREALRRRDHQYQVGVRLGIGVPYRFRLQYGGDDAAQCEESTESFCNGLGEAMLDVGLEFAFTPTLELFTILRIGLANESFTGANTLQLGLGIRTYTNPTDLVKVYLGAALMFDFGSIDEANRARVGDYGSFDFGLRGQIGVQFDVIRYLGIFLQIDPQVFFLRYLDAALGGSLGLQGRFP